MLIVEPFYSDHMRLDERSLALHKLVAEKVRAAPALLNKARANVRRWQEASENVSPALAEWAQVLASPASQVLALLTERSARRSTHGSESRLTKISRMTGNKVDSPLEARGRLA